MRLTDEFEAKAGIYIFTNIFNRKRYIGETVNIRERILRHRRAKNNQVIHSAINKYGVENFEVEIYYLPDFSKKDLLDLEEQLIIKFNSIVPNGYNVRAKGEDNTGTVFSEAARQNMSKAQMGKKHSQETIEKMKKSNKRANLGKTPSEESRAKMALSRIGEKNHMYGKCHSEETKAKISEKAKGRKVSEKTKQKISNSLKEKENHWTEERRRAASERIKGEKNPIHNKKISEKSRKKLLEEGRKQDT